MSSAVSSTVLERLLMGQAPPGAETVSERILRRVLRVQLDDGRIAYAKQHLFPFARVRLRYALRASPTQHEAAMLARAAELGVVVPRVLGEQTSRGFLGPKLAVLVTQALEGLVALAPVDRLRAAIALAERGIWHPDLHEDNVFAVGSGGDQRWAYLDFQSCRIQSQALRGDALARMLAPCGVEIVKSAGRGALEQGLEKSDLAESLNRAGASTANVVERTFDRMRSEAASRRRHRLRSSSAIEREPSGRLRRRGVELPADYRDERTFDSSRWGSIHIAVNDQARVARLRGCLREAWACADPDFGNEPAFLAWEPETVWWKGGGSLYIALPDNGLASLPCFAADQCRSS